MSKVVKVFNLILSSLLIALINIYLIMPNGLINFGFVGVSEIVSLKTGCNPGIILIIINAFIICVSSIFLDIKRIKPYVPTAILIPVFMSIIYHFSRYVSIELPEMMLVILIAGLSCGLCYGVLYQ